MRTTLTRIAVASLSATAVVGIAACGPGGAPSVGAPTSGGSTSSSSSAAPTSPSSPSTPSTSSTSPSSPATPSTTTSSSSDSTSAPAGTALPAGCSTKLSPQTAALRYGQPAVYKDDNGTTVCMTVKKLTVAPESAYGGTVSKANGTLYYMTVNYANVTGGTKQVEAGDMNQLELHPIFSESQTGKTLYSSVPGCDNDSDYTPIPAGQSRDTCIAYQITGATVTSSVYDNYTLRYTWK
ncbi:hypothetical protein [Allobranchiibius huperziae]|uniref:Cytoskeletal protein RodZ n=1 Tax=Allobranchiibius huperziae TaxID=1874116 RepID=A0A853D8X6_9MICO|nr:hypothetical protein [Allobranchiibius huperziae]NYJ73418.1 cytoskeletal protein RodZ [Allobranchiibius huperziae]